MSAQKKAFITAEIGINHNGDLDITRKMIDLAALAGCDAVKFQKRTIDEVYTKEFLDSPRQSPWGTTQRAQKEGLEFSEADYFEIDQYCKDRGVEWYASCWDVPAQIFMRRYNLRYNKIASAMLTNAGILEAAAEEKKYTFIATGMSTWEEIDMAVAIFKKHDCPFELLHCVSIYPMAPAEANLYLIKQMQERYDCPIGFSSHEVGNIATLGAIALGASSIERHITLDRTMYGSDQSSSVEPAELIAFVKQIREMEAACGSGERELTDKEMATRKKLRG